MEKYDYGLHKTERALNRPTFKTQALSARGLGSLSQPLPVM
jgi:hypothetical protein